MFFKEDWEKCKERFDAYWQGEIIDRCCISVTAPRNKPLDLKTVQREARDVVEQWTDAGHRLDQFLHHSATTYFGGEAYPNFWNNLGPGVVASFLGSGFKLASDTVWFDQNPIIKDWANMPEIKLDFDSEMWKILMNLMTTFLENSNGRYYVGMTDLGGNYDIASSLRGAENLLYDLYDYPEEVKALVEKIDLLWFACYDKLQSQMDKYMEGTSSWMGMWCRERWYPLQCDFSAMISPAMFEEFVKPSLIRECDFLDKSIYHWDGPGEIPHLDHLLDIDRLTGIQWTPGDGNPGCGDEVWYPLYKRIQQKGKNLVLFMGAKDIEKLLENISPKGLFIGTHCESEDEARELLKKAEKWSCKCK